MEKIINLPIANSPIIGLQYLAYPLCILLNHNECYPWFFSNYIQLIWSKDRNSAMSFYPDHMHMNPWLEVQYLKREILENNNINIHKFLTESLLNQRYIYSKFDEFYVPRRPAYKTTHFLHDFLLYGYDSANKEYFLLGYDDTNHFSTTKISFSEFEEAFFSGDNINPDINLLSKKSAYTYEFDRELAYELLTDYLNSRNSSENFRVFRMQLKNRVFGISIYDYLIKYFVFLKSQTEDIDFKPLHVFYEHKKCMTLRIKYLMENGYLGDNKNLLDDCFRIENTINTLRHLQIKYKICNNNYYLDRIITSLSSIEKIEKETLESLLNILK